MSLKNLYLAFVILFCSAWVQSAFADDGWTFTTSEEYPPLTLNDNHLVSGMNCVGAYCDNVQLRFTHINRNFVTHAWTSYFSEEGTNYRVCGTNSFVTGISCNGAYCDNVSLQCSAATNLARGTSCYWTGWFSEESGVQQLPAGYYMAGLQCSGSYCDNKRMYVCNAL